MRGRISEIEIGGRVAVSIQLKYINKSNHISLASLLTWGRLKNAWEIPKMPSRKKRATAWQRTISNDTTMVKRPENGQKANELNQWAHAGKAVLCEICVDVSWFVGFIARFCNLLQFPNTVIFVSPAWLKCPHLVQGLPVEMDSIDCPLVILKELLHKQLDVSCHGSLSPTPESHSLVCLCGFRVSCKTFPTSANHLGFPTNLTSLSDYDAVVIILLHSSIRTTWNDHILAISGSGLTILESGTQVFSSNDESILAGKKRCSKGCDRSVPSPNLSHSDPPGYWRGQAWPARWKTCRLQHTGTTQMYTNLVLVMTLSTLFFHVSSLLKSNFLGVWHLEDHLKHGRKRFIRKIIGEPTVRNANDAGVLGLQYSTSLYSNRLGEFLRISSGSCLCQDVLCFFHCSSGRRPTKVTPHSCSHWLSKLLAVKCKITSAAGNVALWWYILLVKFIRSR